MIADVVLAHTRAQLEEELRTTTDPELADAIRAALCTDESSSAWVAAELALARSASS